MAKALIGFLEWVGRNKALAGVGILCGIAGVALAFYSAIPRGTPQPEDSPIEQAWAELSTYPLFVEDLRIGVSQTLDVSEYLPALRGRIDCDLVSVPDFVTSVSEEACIIRFTGQSEALAATAQLPAPALGAEENADATMRVCRTGSRACRDLSIPLTFANEVRGYIDVSHVTAPMQWPQGTRAEVTVLLDSRRIEAPLRCVFPDSHRQGDVALVRQTGACSAVLENIKADSGTRYGIDLLDQFGRTLDTYVLSR